MRNEEILLKELDLISSCINRMANNSFLIKGWYITVLIGVLTIFISKDNYNFFSLGIILLIITIIFGLMDMYYLYLEKNIGESMSGYKKRWNSKKFAFNLNPHEKGMWLKKDKLLRKTFKSSALWLYYLVLIGIIIYFIFENLGGKICI